MRVTVETDDGTRYGAAFPDSADPVEVGDMVRTTIENIKSRDLTDMDVQVDSAE